MPVYCFSVFLTYSSSRTTGVVEHSCVGIKVGILRDFALSCFQLKNKSLNKQISMYVKGKYYIYIYIYRHTHTHMGLEFMGTGKSNHGE